ncbi:MAG: PilZ domain-containing protein [Thermodesulfobacteriota bacterium]
MDKRRFERVPVAVDIEILVLRKGSGEIVGGPVAAAVVDVSPAGAGLTLASIRAGALHLFYGPKDDLNLVLRLRFSGEDGAPRHIDVIPVWFDKELDSAPPFYRLGVEFIERPASPSVRELLRILKPAGSIGRWLRELFGERV